MVQFLLHNTLGAWWAGKVLAARPELAHTAAGEEELRRACALLGCEWTYLRFVRAEEDDRWRPAAGTFGGWPERAAEITVLDPCCGSGHFLVEAFGILVSMRMAEEGLSERQASDAVLRDNLFGLEIDERCTQIAAFNLALAAWTYPGAGDYRPLPELHKDLYDLYLKSRDWRSENYRYRTEYTVEKNGRALHPIDLTELRPEHFEAWKSERLKKAGKETVRVDLCVISSILRYGVRIGWLRENPLKRVEFPRGDRLQDDPATYLSFEDFEKGHADAGRNAPAIQFAVATGLRVSELCRLEWKDIKDGGITVTSKGKKRVVPLIPRAQAALDAIPRHLTSQRVFWWLRRREYAYNAFQRAQEKAGIGPYTFHQLRHTYASWSAMAGCDLYALAKNMGISSLTVLKRYAHLSPTFRKSEADKLEDFWGTRAAHVTRKDGENQRTPQIARY
jgi:integrase